MSEKRPSFRRHWALPVIVLTGSALVVFWAFYLLDFYVTAAVPDSPPSGPVEHYVRFDPGSITDAVSQLAAMIAAVFGIVITVVSLIVQLSADRYTGVARMFLRDRVNLGVIAYYIIATAAGIWLSVSLQSDYTPRATLLAMMSATT